MARRVLLLLVVAGLGLGFFAWLSTSSRPGANPEASPDAGRAPDYRDGSSWARLSKPDEDAKSRPADVFYLHPTTYGTGEAWNARLDDDDVNRITDRGPIAHQTPAFDAAARVFAPRYRQALVASYFDDTGPGVAARELAYSDVEAAFDHFVERWNGERPFVLAGHSQGADHLLRLLERRIDGSPEAQRMVAAYLIGIAVPLEKLDAESPLAPCENSLQTGCVVSWNSVAAGVRPRWHRRLRHAWRQARSGELPDWRPNDSRRLLCTNPLSWRIDGEPASASEMSGGALSPPSVRVSGPPEARCVEGYLEIAAPADPGLERSRRGDYHALDVALFFSDLEKNVDQRIRRFLEFR